jgi:hypothetical protein
MDGRWQFPSCIHCEQHHRPEPPGNRAHHQIPFTLVFITIVHVTTVLYCRRVSIVQLRFAQSLLIGFVVWDADARRIGKKLIEHV